MSNGSEALVSTGRLDWATWGGTAQAMYPERLKKPGQALAATYFYACAGVSLIVGLVATAVSSFPGNLALLASSLLSAGTFVAFALMAQSVHDSAHWAKVSAELLRRADERAVRK